MSAAKNYQGTAFGFALGFAIEGKTDHYINSGFALDGFSINGKGMSATFWGAAFTLKPEIRLKEDRVALLPGIGLGLGSANENGSSKITPYGRAQIDVVISIPNKPTQIVFDVGIMAFDGGFNSASPIVFFRVGFLK